MMNKSAIDLLSVLKESQVQVTFQPKEANKQVER